MTTGIYKITNLVNGKVYIGASKRIEARWSNHKRCVGSPIHSDLEALGEENFKFEVLFECPEDMLCQWERDMICLYDADDPEKGYNCKNDRPYSLKRNESFKGRKAWNKGLKNIYSDETRRKISETLKGRVVSEETKRKMSESHKGHKRTDEVRHKMKGRIPWNKGLKMKPCSEEVKCKISETLKGRVVSEETKRKMSESHKGKPAWNRGKPGTPCSEETKRKISEARRRRSKEKEV